MPRKVPPAGQQPNTYEPKVSAHCRDSEHDACTGQAFNARTAQWQRCACPCHKARVKLS